LRCVRHAVPARPSCPTPICNDGTRYRWTLAYDPTAASGRGRFAFSLRGGHPKAGALSNADIPEAHKAEARRCFQDVTTFDIDLPEGIYRQSATFGRFGLMNLMRTGGSVTI